MSGVVTTRGLAMRFGRRDVLRGIDLEIEEGSVTALLGRNGVGKSTLLRLLVGLHPPTAGESRVLGLDPARRGPDVRRLVGYVPERLELPRWMTIRGHFAFAEPFHPTWDADLAAALARRLDLEPTARIATLSKGQRAKHALVAALAHRPALLLLDEPFSGLDPVVRHEVLTAVMGHLRDEGRTVVMVSHSMADVERAADRVVLLDDGRVRLDAPLDELQRRARRVAVTLRDAAAPWTPPRSTVPSTVPGTIRRPSQPTSGRSACTADGSFLAPYAEREGADVVLTYLDWDETREAALAADPAVAEVRALPRDLDDVFRAAVTKETDPCVA